MTSGACVDCRVGRNPTAPERVDAHNHAAASHGERSYAYAAGPAKTVSIPRRAGPAGGSFVSGPVGQLLSAIRPAIR